MDRDGLNRILNFQFGSAFEYAASLEGLKLRFKASVLPGTVKHWGFDPGSEVTVVKDHGITKGGIRQNFFYKENKGGEYSYRQLTVRGESGREVMVDAMYFDPPA